ncbi:mediator of RNA polymerase II transcription subunit 21-like [Artemia franciscana]|uniref:mediator of RNA polymerase II transcription subunit 21-like n=1 Tax=Artemia franciscana TaxID=6661 RepID=UPI0032D9EBCE
MADRITQLQDYINNQADNFCNAIGVLQRFAVPSPVPGFDRGSATPQQNQTEMQDLAKIYAEQIARTAKDIDVLIESLPSEESTTDLQVASLQKLEHENFEAALKLESVVKEGETLLEHLQKVLHEIAQSQLQSQDVTMDTN